MRWSGIRSLLLVALAAAAPAGCASNTTAPTPPPVLTTETFTGTLTAAGSTYAFTAKSGQVTVTLQSLSPDTTLKLSMSLGVYNVYYAQCTALTGNGAIAMSGQLIGLATATTTLCIQIIDPNPIPAGLTETFVITADHY